tara:strand:- start:486 stop:644 length:159 start_codon:yes stop_codon:yes gene_type:complete
MKELENKLMDSVWRANYLDKHGYDPGSGDGGIVGTLIVCGLLFFLVKGVFFS